MPSTWISTRMDTSNHGLSLHFKARGANAKGLTGIKIALVKSLHFQLTLLTLEGWSVPTDKIKIKVLVSDERGDYNTKIVSRYILISTFLFALVCGTHCWSLSSYEKRIYRAAVSQRLRNTVLGYIMLQLLCSHNVWYTYIVNILIVFLSLFCVSSPIMPHLYLHTAKGNAPTATILFFAFNSDLSIILNLLVQSSFNFFFLFVDAVYLHFSVTRYLHVFSWSSCCRHISLLTSSIKCSEWTNFPSLSTIYVNCTTVTSESPIDIITEVSVCRCYYYHHHHHDYYCVNLLCLHGGNMWRCVDW